MFPMSLPRPFIAWEGEAPAEPLHRWLGRSLALPGVLPVLGFAKMFRAVGRSLRSITSPCGATEPGNEFRFWEQASAAQNIEG